MFFFLGRQRRGGRGASDKEVTPPLLAKVQGNLEVNRTPALVEPISSNLQENLNIALKSQPYRVSIWVDCTSHKDLFFIILFFSLSLKRHYLTLHYFTT